MFLKSGWETPSLDEALTSMERLAQLPPIENLTYIVHNCRADKNLGYTMRLYAYMCETGLSDPLGNYLVPMFVQVGSLCDAQQVFNKLVDRNEYSWTSLIKGYIECGEVKHALNLYEEMQEYSVHPSKYTFVAVLKACARLKDAERGREIHAEISKMGLERDLVVANTFVDMYAKCGSLIEAREAFDKLPIRTVVSWNALMAGYAEQGLGEEALNCFRRMQLKGLSPIAVTFVCSLKACGSIGALDKGREMHSEIARNGLDTDLILGNALVDMYSKCGSLAEAWEAFDKLPVRNEVSWTALMAGYAEQGLGEEALNCLEQMQLEGVCPNAVTFVCSLKACGIIGAIEKGRDIHAKIARKGLERNLVIGNILVDMYAKCGLLVEARDTFNRLPIRTVVTWNALIAGYAEQGLGEEVLNCLEQMELEGLFPTAVTFICSLKACGRVGAIDRGREIHTKISRKGLEGDRIVGNTLVDMYGKCGLLAEARQMFDKLPVQNEVAWTALIAGYAEQGVGEEVLNCLEQMQLVGVSPNAVTFACSLRSCGSIGAIDEGREIHAEIARKGLEGHFVVGNTLVDMYAKCWSVEEAWEAFYKLPARDEVSWTALIAGYAEQGLGEEALQCLEEMKFEGFSLDAVTFVCALKACGSIGAIDKGREIHADISRKGLERHLVVGSSFVDMYSKCGSLAEAQEAFDKLSVQNVVSWNTLIAAYAQQGECEIVFYMFYRMRRDGIKPDGATFSIVLTVCSHTGLVNKGQKYFEAVSKDYDISPSIEHHVGMVDLLGRAGQVDNAVAMVKKMPFRPNLVVWLTVLGACKKWGHVDLGRLAFKHALQLDERAAAGYVLMSNIYADVHM